MFLLPLASENPSNDTIWNSFAKVLTDKVSQAKKCTQSELQVAQ